MLIAMLLALAPQEAKAMEEIRGVAIVPPARWTRAENAEAGNTQLTAPGLAEGQEAALQIFQVAATPAATAEALHQQVSKALAQSWKVDREGESGRAGEWRTSRQDITLPNGMRAWTKIYTTKSGANGAFILYFATSEELFKTHVAEADKAVAAARIAARPAAGAVAVNGLLLAMPPGWTRKDNPQTGSVAFTPPPPKSALEPTWDYVMHVLPRQPLQGTFSETHRMMVAELAKASGLANPATTMRVDGPGPFIMSGMAGDDANGRRRNFTLYSARSEGHIECVLIENQEDLDTVRAILARSTVKEPVKGAARPKVVEAFRRAERPIQPGSLERGSLIYERLWLRSDGVVDFSRQYPGGYALASEPLKTDPATLNGDFGAWKAVGNEVHVVRSPGGKPTIYRRDGAKLVNGGEVWQPMPSVDGMKLDGRYGWKSEPPIRIEFTKDGRFRDEGVLDHVTLGAPKPRKSGAGTYEIREWTLFVKYEDGTVWTTDFSTLGADAANVDGIVIRTYAFAKE